MENQLYLAQVLGPQLGCGILSYLHLVKNMVPQERWIKELVESGELKSFYMTFEDLGVVE